MSCASARRRATSGSPFAGALVDTVPVYAVGTAGRGAPTPLRLALAGAALPALMYSLVRALLVGNQETLDGFRFRVVGSLAGRSGDVAWQVAPFAPSRWSTHRR
jgi:ABC-type Fe3+-siderophore transport system permease subunit